MQVSLKRAHYLEKTAAVQAKKTSYEPLVRFSIFDSLTDTTNMQCIEATHVANNAAKYELNLALIKAIYAIRRQLAKASMAHGIDELLNTWNRLKDEEAHFRSIIATYEKATGFERTFSALQTRSQVMREGSKVDRYSVDADVKTVAYMTTTVEVVNGWRLRLAHIVEERAQVNDSLTMLNVSKFIMLSDETTQTLRKANIILAPSGELAGQDTPT